MKDIFSRLKIYPEHIFSCVITDKTIYNGHHIQNLLLRVYINAKVNYIMGVYVQISGNCFLKVLSRWFSQFFNKRFTPYCNTLRIEIVLQ